MPQAIRMVDVRPPEPISWHGEVGDHVVHGVAHGERGQAIVLWDHLYHVFRAFIEVEAQSPRCPDMKICDSWPFW